MSPKIEKVAVLGAGTMGSQIAGHLANAGIPSMLYDVEQDLAESGLKKLTELKPAPLFNPKSSKLIEPCNYHDHLKKIKDADWIMEAVAEKLEIKHAVYKNIIPYIKETAIISSNTSGIPLDDLVSAFTKELRPRFLITHFFNPPRYMRLLELVKGTDTDINIYNQMALFGENVLGKGIVHAKDTPNFIGNRIGVHGGNNAIRLAKEMGLTIEEVDKLTGTIIGRPKSGIFRTTDIVGIDVHKHVSGTSYDNLPDDEAREILKAPSILKKLIESGRLGQKTKSGFYKKTDEGILSIDLDTGEYGPMKKVRFDGYRLAKGHQNTEARIKALYYSEDKAGKYFMKITSDSLIYSANRIPEISDDIFNLDNAMKWGYGWELGPFETWDAIGVRNSINKMKEVGVEIPSWVEKMLKTGRENFYSLENGVRYCWCPIKEKPEAIQPRPNTINLFIHKTKKTVLKRDLSASVVDLGDGVLNVEFHSILQKDLNPIDSSYIEMINYAIDLTEEGKYGSIVIGHQGKNFCAGANLNLLLDLSRNCLWDEMNMAIKLTQDLTQRIRFSKAPIIAAPFQLVLGGGVELVQPAAHRVAAAESYMGYVEVGVGLIPGAGGNLRMILNALDKGTGRMGAFQKIKNTFETIGFAKIATSANQAKHLGYLEESDTIIMNSDQLLFKAKSKALELMDNYSPPKYREDLKLPGSGGRTAMAMALKGFKVQGKISDHDVKIGEKLAYVLTGGDKAGLTKSIDEQYILDIEREAFVSLAGEKLTQDRIKYMLEKGKPLRN
tara:strand:+ start:933 stop:3275 length:2343 start_codon:yes stop_codon:yes gene_type:complete